MLNGGHWSTQLGNLDGLGMAKPLIMYWVATQSTVNKGPQWWPDIRDTLRHGDLQIRNTAAWLHLQNALHFKKPTAEATHCNIELWFIWMHTRMPSASKKGAHRRLQVSYPYTQIALLSTQLERWGEPSFSFAIYLCLCGVIHHPSCRIPPQIRIRPFSRLPVRELPGTSSQGGFQCGMGF